MKQEIIKNQKDWEEFVKKYGELKWIDGEPINGSFNPLNARDKCILNIDSYNEVSIATYT